MSSWEETEHLFPAETEKHLLNILDEGNPGFLA